MLAASAVGAPFVGYKRAAFLEPDGTPVAFALDLADKDLGLIAALAESLGVPMPQAGRTSRSSGRRSGDVGGDRDFSTVADAPSRPSEPSGHDRTSRPEARLTRRSDRAGVQTPARSSSEKGTSP